MAHLASPAEAGRETADRINAEIDRNLEESPTLRARYDERAALQAKIDQHRAEGRRVPLEWIKNPFYKRYYVYMGWSDQD